MSQFQIVSLGSACDIANNLNKLALRKRSLFFDWLWNLDSGLSFINQCITENFNNVTSAEPYVYKYHYRFKKEMCVYKCANSVVHLHSNPIENHEDHETLIRRAHRTNKIFSSADFKYFIYYRAFPEDYLKSNKSTIQSSYNRLIAEAKEFIDVFSEKYPEQRQNYHLLLILQVELENIQQVKQMIRQTNNLFKQVSIDCMVYRNDASPENLKIWAKQFYKIILNQKSIPFIIKSLLIFRHFKSRIKNILVGMKKLTQTKYN